MLQPGVLGDVDAALLPALGCLAEGPRRDCIVDKAGLVL
jgi:hypothetical protein